MIPAVILSEKGRLDAENRAHSLPVSGKGLSSAQDLLDIPRRLDVENALRYRRTPEHTFCNVFAHDAAREAGLYIPRVWWSPAALEQLRLGQAAVPVEYGKTVLELNANQLSDWFDRYGADFGWRRLTTAFDAQNLANQGVFAVIVARKRLRSSSGHISVVMPETHQLQAVCKPVFLPVQAQAGAQNFCCAVPPSAWWTGASYDAHGFWAHTAVETM